MADTPGRTLVWVVASCGVSFLVDRWSLALAKVHHVRHGIAKMNISNSQDIVIAR